MIPYTYALMGINRFSGGLVSSRNQSHQDTVNFISHLIPSPLPMTINSTTKSPTIAMTWHTLPECRNLYREYKCGHNEVIAVIGHRLCRHCKDGTKCEPQGMQDYLFDNDNECGICKDEQFANLDDIERQKLLWAQDAREADKKGAGEAESEPTENNSGEVQPPKSPDSKE
jgi:hypothetical protein